MKREYKIYCLKEPNSNRVRYIGLTQFSLNHRLSEHKRKKSNTHKYKWIQSLLLNSLYPEIELIENDLTREEAVIKEKFFIKLFKSVGAQLTNSTDGGDSSMGYKHTETTKRKISELKKGNKYMLGKKHSKESRLKMSISHKGKKKSDEFIKKLAKRMIGNSYTKGLKLSKETKRKMSKARKLEWRTGKRKGTKMTPENVAKQRLKMLINNPFKGKRHTEESLKKMSESHKNSEYNLKYRKGRTWKMIDGHRIWMDKK